MNCIVCNVDNAQGANYCANCGARLDLTSGPLKDMLDASVKVEINRALQGYLKDQKIVEFDVTEKVANRLLGWGKIFATLVGVLAILLGVLGVKSVTDLVNVAKKGKKDLESTVQNARREAAEETKKLTELNQQSTQLHQTYAKLSSELPEYEQIKDAINLKFNALKGSLDEQNQRIGELSQQVQTLVQPQPIPEGPGRYPFHLRLDSQVEPNVLSSIQSSGKLVFQLTGDTGGVKNPRPEILVARAMQEQFNPNELGESPAFLYLLGNIIYYYGEASEYYGQFYAPYKEYHAPIFAIPGNHDGSVQESKPGANQSLAAFMENFCAKSSRRTPESVDVARPAMTQPNCYWTLESPLATIIGLYTNVLLNGFLDDKQKEWLVAELKAAPKDKALILAMHASPYAEAGDETDLGVSLEAVFKSADRLPDIVFSAHAHLYMRFTRSLANRDLPYVIVGTGGYFHLKKAPEFDATRNSELKRERSDDRHHGFMKISVTKSRILCEYFAVEDNSAAENHSSTMIDRLELDLSSHRILPHGGP